MTPIETREEVVAALNLRCEMLARPFGEQIWAARRALGLNRTEAAEMLGISSIHLRHLEDGRGLPGFVLFLRMLETYSLSADLALGWRASSIPSGAPVIDPGEIAAALGPAVRRAREALGMSCLQAAQRIGISHRYLRELESSQARPGLVVFTRLLEEFDLSADAILRPETDRTEKYAAPIEVQPLRAASGSR